MSKLLNLFFQLTRKFLSRRFKENAETGLEIRRATTGIPPAKFDAICEHQSPGSWVQHVVGGGEHEAGDELEVDVRVGAGEGAVLSRSPQGQGGQVEPLGADHFRAESQGQNTRGRKPHVNRGHLGRKFLG